MFARRTGSSGGERVWMVLAIDNYMIMAYFELKGLRSRTSNATITKIKR